MAWARALPYDPYGLAFDGAGFRWRTGERLSVPGKDRFRFFYNSTSEGACTDIRKTMRVFRGGRLVSRPFDLPDVDGAADLDPDNATVYLRAMVRVSDATWAVSDLAVFS